MKKYNRDSQGRFVGNEINYKLVFGHYHPKPKSNYLLTLSKVADVTMYFLGCATFALLIMAVAIGFN